MSSATEAVIKENTSKKRKKEFRKKNSSELLNEKNNSLKSKRSRNEEANEVKRKDLPKLKKKVVSQIKELQEILQTTKPPDENEKKLEGLVFGHTSEEFLEEEDMCCEDLDDDDDDEVPIEEVKDAEKKQRLAAWEDDDDETLLVKEKASQFKNCHRSVSLRGDEKYSNFVQEKFLKEMGGTPKWAEQNSDLDDSNDDSEDELLQKTGNFVIQEQSLPKGHINIRKTPSLVDPNMRKSMIKTCEFHPTSKVAAIAATNGTAVLFQIDGKVNAKIQSLKFEDFPVHTAHFSTDGVEILAGSCNKAHFFSYDMFAGKICRIPWQKEMPQWNVRRFQMSPDGKYIVIHGRYGQIHLMSAKTKEWIGSLKMNGEVIAVTFNTDGSRMYSHGSTGEVHVWDMTTRSCIHKFIDEGCLSGTALAVSPNGQFLATGSDKGVVNIYDNRTIFNLPSPEPIKAVMNLTTEVTNLKFNNTSEILAMSSSFLPESVKLVHFPSLTVFPNFPVRNEFFRHANSIDISPNSGYMCIGSNVGCAYLYRLKHYRNY